MTFEKILTAMKEDHRVQFTRPNWKRDDGKIKTVSRMYIEEFDFVNTPYFISSINEDDYEIWTPSISDIFADDWS